MLAEHAIVRDVCAGHDEAVRPYDGRTAAARGAAVDGRVLANDAVRADDERGVLALVAEILCLAAKHGERRDPRPRADGRSAADHDVRVERDAILQRHLVADDGEGADSDVRTEARPVFDDG